MANRKKGGPRYATLPYMDNFYNSISLAAKLLPKKTNYTTGRLRMDRKYILRS